MGQLGAEGCSRSYRASQTSGWRKCKGVGRRGGEKMFTAGEAYVMAVTYVPGSSMPVSRSVPSGRRRCLALCSPRRRPPRASIWLAAMRHPGSVSNPLGT